MPTRGEHRLREHRLRERPWIAPALLTLLALVVRVATVALWWDLPLWGDEKHYWAAAVAMSAGDPYPVYHPPLWGAVLSAVAACTSNPAYGRLLTALLGTAIVPVVYGLARTSFSRRVAIVAAALCAVHPELVGYSHYLWSETFVALLFATAAWMLVATLEGGVRPRRMWALSAVLGLACLAKESAVILFAAALLTASAVRFDRKAWVLAGAVAVVAAPVVAYSAYASCRDDRLVLLADAPFKNASLVAHGGSAREMAPEDQQEMFLDDIAGRVVRLPKVYPVQLARLWTPNSFVAHRLVGAPARSGPAAADGTYEVPQAGVLATLTAAASVLVVLLGLTGLLVADPSRLRTFTLWNLVLLSAAPLVFLMCSRFRLPFTVLLIPYAAVFLADPAAIVRRSIRPMAWILWGGTVGLYSAVVVAKWSTIGRWG